MESRTNRKRPWEDENAIDVQPKRAGPNVTAFINQHPSPLPPRAGHYTHGDYVLDQQRLPPRPTSSESTLAQLVISSYAQQLPSLQAVVPLGILRPRAQSLFDVFQHRHWKIPPSSHAEDPPIYCRSTGRTCLPHSGLDLRPGHGPELAHAARTVTCCSPNCQDQACSNSRLSTQKVATDLGVLANRVRRLTRTEHDLFDTPLEPECPRSEEPLQQALRLLHESDFRPQGHMEHRSSHRPRSPSPPHDASEMRRARDYLNGREEQLPSTRQHLTPHGYDEFSRPKSGSYVGNSSQNTTSSSGSIHPPLQSPMQTPQPTSSVVLPSPSSLNFPSSQSLPSMSPPATSQTSAQSADLQDLQHQVTIKNFEFQTLQREYDALLQTLERQKTKCATFEKKLEVSDMEINSLRDEKERLLAQVVTVEGQIEELQQSRDEARRQLVANGAQYVRIMDMANRLQSQSAEDKRKWEAERTGLEQRIRLLEEAMVTGTQKSTLTAVADQQPGITPGPSSIGLTHSANTSISSQAETTNVLRTEVGRLRSRTQTLEATVQTMRCESLSIQTAARQILESGGKMGDIAQDLVGGDG